MSILSKYGVSDMFIALSGQYPEYQLARIITQYKGSYKIACESGELLAEISGKFNFETNQLVTYPAVGDYVTKSCPNIGRIDTVVSILRFTGH